MYKVKGFGHMTAKVDALTQKIKNLTITLATIVVVVTPNYEMYGVH